MKVFNRATSSAALLSLAVATAGTAYGQQLPDAGSIYQESREDRVEPLRPSVDIQLEGQPLTEREAGGPDVEITQIQFSNNEAFSSQQLLDVLGEDVYARNYDLSGLQALANKISQFYRAEGYPFARAVLPAQTLDDGILEIVVVEGRYGEITASGDADAATMVQKFLHPLESGALIESNVLERTLLIAGDLPGITITPVLRPGQVHGTGDLDVQIGLDDRVRTRLGVDNHGSRFSGEYRGRMDVQANRLLLAGDALSVSALYSSEETWLGQLHYAVPLGYRGLRGNIGYDYTDYTLGKGFEGYTGTAEVFSGGLSYPLIRRQQSNVRLSATYLHKNLGDNADFLDYVKATESRSLPLTLQFDHRDRALGGGVSYGAVSVTPGKLDIDQIAQEADDYRFTKVNLDVARVQMLDTDLTLFGRFSGQWSDRRYLDGSESFTLGGPNGVRAFPVGEGSDSRGWLAQLELRYDLRNGLVPYILLDGGRSPNGGIDDGDDRNLSGAGFGLRYNQNGWSADLVSAWKLEGGDALSDDRQRDPRFWFRISYQL